MNLIEFIGFVVSMLALIWLMGKRAKEERQKRREEYSEEEEHEIQEQKEQIKEMFKELNLDVYKEEEDVIEEIEQLPPPPPKKVPARAKKDFKTSFANYELHTDVEDHYLESNITDESIDIYDESVVSTDMTFNDKTPYKISQKTRESKIQHQIGKLSSLRQMVYYHEILGKPKAFRNVDAHEIHLSD